jgi:tetratricopeptide (TPR) repeat protein
LYLIERPDSRTGRSNRALYWSALGQYDKALADLEEAVNLNPFGRGLIQPTLLNLGAIQVVLGKNAEALETAKQLTTPFDGYLRVMLATAQSQWRLADSLATAALAEPEAQGVFHVNALTSRAGALAALGNARAADSVLRDGVSSSKGSAARWFERARLLLALSTSPAPSLRADIVPGDTTIAARTLRAMWAAAAGDTTAAQAALGLTQNLSRRDAAIIGTAPLLIQSFIDAKGRRWRPIVDRMGAIALAGEQDPTILDRPDSFLQRLVVANAYRELGNRDSSARYLNLMLQPTHLPPGHFALRGLSYDFARRQLAALAATPSTR